MDLQDVLSDYNIRKGTYYQYEIDTPIGALQISLRDKHLCTNFINFEDKAKLVQGHWKNNRFIETAEDCINHIKSIFKLIERYKLALKQGDFNYGTSRQHIQGQFSQDISGKENRL